MQHSDVSYKLNVKYKKPDKRLTLYLSIYIKFRIKKTNSYSVWSQENDWRRACNNWSGTNKVLEVLVMFYLLW